MSSWRDPKRARKIIIEQHDDVAEEKKGQQSVKQQFTLFMLTDGFLDLWEF